MARPVVISAASISFNLSCKYCIDINFNMISIRYLQNIAISISILSKKVKCVVFGIADLKFNGQVFFANGHFN